MVRQDGEKPCEHLGVAFGATGASSHRGEDSKSQSSDHAGGGEEGVVMSVAASMLQSTANEHAWTMQVLPQHSPPLATPIPPAARLCSLGSPSGQLLSPLPVQPALSPPIPHRHPHPHPAKRAHPPTSAFTTKPSTSKFLSMSIFSCSAQQPSTYTQASKSISQYMGMACGDSEAQHGSRPAALMGAAGTARLEGGCAASAALAAATPAAAPVERCVCCCSWPRTTSLRPASTALTTLVPLAGQ